MKLELVWCPKCRATHPPKEHLARPSNAGRLDRAHAVAMEEVAARAGVFVPPGNEVTPAPLPLTVDWSQCPNCAARREADAERKRKSREKKNG